MIRIPFIIAFLLHFSGVFSAPVAGFCEAQKNKQSSFTEDALGNRITARANSANLQGLPLSETNPVSPKLFGNIRGIVAHGAQLKAYIHPRVVVDGKEWKRILLQYTDKKVFTVKGTWANYFYKFSFSKGPLSLTIAKLADLHMSRITSVYDGRPYNRGFEYETYRQRLKPLADLVPMMSALGSTSFFMCAFWAGINEHSEKNILPDGSDKKCIHATVVWSTLLLAHHAYHCNPECPDSHGDNERTFIWNTKKYWEAIDDFFSAGSSIALAYDVLYDRMSLEEREIVRSVIALLVLNRHSWGNSEESSAESPNAEMDPHRIFSNWALYNSNLYITNLAIEGEIEFNPYTTEFLSQHGSKGFNNGLNEKYFDLIIAYMSHAIYPDGATVEDGYTQFRGMREGSLGLLASHKRGSGVLDTPRFRNFIYYTAQIFEPWQCGDLVGHGSGGGNSYNTFIGLFKYIYPDGELPAMLWRQRFGSYDNQNPCRIEWWQTMIQLAFLGGEHTTNAESPEGLSEETQEEFKLSMYTTRRGLLVARGSLSEEASYLHFNARPDAFFPERDNADRGVITYAALGQTWLDDFPWKTNSDSRKHSLMHIDGLAQGEKAPSVKVVRVLDNGRLFLAVANLTYAYNVQWVANWNSKNAPHLNMTFYDEAGSPSHESVKFDDKEYSSPWELGWPEDDDGADLGFSKSTVLYGVDYIGFKGLWTWKRDYRELPLLHMVRSVGLIRSRNDGPGLAFFVDSADAGSGSHVFESYLILKPTVHLDNNASLCKGNYCRIFLEGSDEAVVEVHVLAISQALSYRIELLDEGARRIVIRSSGLANEEFWVALLPSYRGENSKFLMEAGEEYMKIIFEGMTYEFKIDDEDNGVVSVDSPPMEPIMLKPWLAHGVEGDSFNTDSDTFFGLSADKIQVIFKFTSLSSPNGIDIDELRTCSWYTTMATKISIYDCGDGESADVNYMSDNCQPLSQLAYKTYPCSSGSHQTKWAGRLEPNYHYIASVSGHQIGNLKPRFSIVHFRRRLRGPARIR